MQPRTILIYYEQRGYGGVDTHMAALINNWPDEKDRFLIFTNQDNEGFDILKEKVKRAEVEFYTINLGRQHSNQHILSKIAHFILYKNLGFLIRFAKVLRVNRPAVLLSNNGGYPGGFTCLLAVLVGRIVRPTMRTFLLIHHAPVLSGKAVTVSDCLALLIRASRVSLLTISCASKYAIERNTPLRGLRVILNGVEAIESAGNVPDLREKYGIPKSRIVVGLIGPIDPHKGHTFAIEAFRQSRVLQEQAHLLVVGRGNGSLVESLESCVKAGGLSDNVTFTGFIRGDVVSIVGQFDILVMPTTDFEGFGYAAAEGMMTGIPVVASDVGAIPEIIENGRNGILVEPKNASQLKTALEHLVLDQRYRDHLGEQGRKRILGHFSARRMAEEYYAFMTEQPFFLGDNGSRSLSEHR